MVRGNNNGKFMNLNQHLIMSRFSVLGSLLVRAIITPTPSNRKATHARAIIPF